MDDFEYVDERELKELFILIAKAQRKKKKDLTFPSEYNKTTSQKIKAQQL